MSFKSQKEIWEFLINGGKIQYPIWSNGYIQLNELGNIIDEKGHIYEGGIIYRRQKIGGE